MKENLLLAQIEMSVQNDPAKTFSSIILINNKGEITNAYAANFSKDKYLQALNQFQTLIKHSGHYFSELKEAHDS